MWGSEHCHGDEGLRSIDGLPEIFPGEDTYSCSGCEAEYPEEYLGDPDGLMRVEGIDGRWCPACRENMTCSLCRELDESVNRGAGKPVCKACGEAYAASPLSPTSRIRPGRPARGPLGRNQPLP